MRPRQPSALESSGDVTKTGYARFKKSRGASKPPWIRKRIDDEARILAQRDRAGIRKHHIDIDSLIEQDRIRREKESHNSPPIPF
jgi:hypothetical protein